MKSNMMAKDVLKIDNTPEYEVVKKEILFIRIDGDFQYENCCIKLYRNRNPSNMKLRAKLEITKVHDDKELKESLQTINSGSVNRIGLKDNKAALQPIYIESTKISFVMFNTSKDSQIKWLESLRRYMLPESKDETKLPLDSSSGTRAKAFRIDSLHSTDFQTEEKDLILEIQNKKSLILKSRESKNTLETWQLNEIKSFKFNESLFKISVGRQHAHDEAMKHIEFRMPNEEKRNLKNFLSDILNERKDIITNFKANQLSQLVHPFQSMSVPSKNIKTVPHWNAYFTTNFRSLSVIPTPPQPLSIKVDVATRPTVPEMKIIPSQKPSKIIPSSEDYEEPYPEFSVPEMKIIPSQKPSKIIPSSEDYEEPNPEFSVPEMKIIPSQKPSKIIPSSEDYEEPNPEFSDVLQKRLSKDIIIPSSEEYEGPNEDWNEDLLKIEKTGQLPKQPEHLGISGVIAKTKKSRLSMRLERYPGPKNGDLYTYVRKNSIKHFIHNIVQHRT
ncbi:UNVERIFIED_CONTAM: hypothetical protein RMT77_010863 [Armadillidium vulgare]